MALIGSGSTSVEGITTDPQLYYKGNGNMATKRKKEESLTRFVNRVNLNQGVYIVHFGHFLELLTQKDAFLRNLSLCMLEPTLAYFLPSF